MANNQDNDGDAVRAAGAQVPDDAATEAGPLEAIAPDEQAVIEQLHKAADEITALTPAATPWDGVEKYDRPAAPVRTAVKLVLFSDGTGNSSAKAEKTNVWRMFQALDQGASDQLAMYDDGVGTSRVKLLAALGGAFGWGLKRNVIDLYKFVCRNYDGPETKIYGFGFSRGAFTIRMLTGLIAREGLVEFTCEEELHSHAVAAYNRFREKCFRPLPLSPVHLYRWLRKGVAALLPPARRLPVRRGIKIEFLGLWDTVSAYGMPVEELRPAIAWLCWPMYFSDLKLSDDVERACHALSLDDQRTSFHPILWDQSSARDQRRISQVWFAGVHSNVGGGYPEDQLSLVSLDWMMQHAHQAGLRLRQRYVAQLCSEKSPFARIYDSRDGLGHFYRYSPRTIAIPGHADGARPVIHGSVIARMARGSDDYAPSALEHDFLVLAPNGELLSPAAAPGEAAQALMRHAAPRTPQLVHANSANTLTAELREALGELTRPDKAALDPIHNLVWWRRIAYVASVACAGLAALFPVIGNWLGLTAASRLDKELGGALRESLDAIAGYLPAFARYWTDAIRESPVEFALIVLAFGASIGISALLRDQLHDFGRFAWLPARQKPYRESLLATEKKRVRDTLYLLLAFDLISVSASASPAVRQLLPAVLALNLVVLARIAWHRRFQRILGDEQRPIWTGLLSHLVAHAARENRFLRRLSAIGRRYVAPSLFGLLLVYAGGSVLNHVAFGMENAAGMYCQSSRQGGAHLPTVTGRVDAASPFGADQMCWRSGLRLEKNTRYRVTITPQGEWRDNTRRTGLRGFKGDSLVHVGGAPLKRMWGERWFAPIAQVGVRGNEEFALKPCTGTWTGKGGPLVSEFTTRSDGELFLFVNDAVLALPPFQDAFYGNNHGSARVQVEPAGNSPYSCPA